MYLHLLLLITLIPATTYRTAMTQLSALSSDLIRHLLSFCNTWDTLSISDALRLPKQFVDWKELAHSHAESADHQELKHYVTAHPNGGRKALRMIMPGNTGCQRCQRPRIRKITWQFRGRLCQPCVDEVTVRDYTLEDSLPRDVVKKIVSGNLPQVTRSTFSYGLGHGEYKCFLKSDVARVCQLHFDQDLAALQALHVQQVKEMEEAKVVQARQKRQTPEYREAQNRQAKRRKRENYLKESLALPVSEQTLLRECPSYANWIHSQERMSATSKQEITSTLKQELEGVHQNIRRLEQENAARKINRTKAKHRQVCCQHLGCLYNCSPTCIGQRCKSHCHADNFPRHGRTVHPSHLVIKDQ